MAISGGMIQNPKKTMVLNFSIEKIKRCTKQIYKFYYDIENGMCKFDDVLNIYKFKCKERLSTGSMLVLTMSEQGENKTQIEIEMQRIIGSYDADHEVQLANNHINTFLELLSSLLTKSEEELVIIENKKPEEIDQSEKKTNRVSWVLMLIIILALAAWIFSDSIF